MSNDYDTNTASASPQERQPPLNRRFEFASYAETRQFLDRLADLSKREDYYPNVSFGKTYANMRSISCCACPSSSSASPRKRRLCSSSCHIAVRLD